ncbi:MAG TPA: MFS transporter [Nocardioidaceae bacterium]|nr:MFS transporter [Nocardioidaceae bacterium]
MADSAARGAVAAVFALNGLAFATWVSRIPEVRTLLDLTPGRLGTLLLALSAGAVLALPSSGAIVQRLGAARMVAGGAVLNGIGLALAGTGAQVLGSVWLTAAGLFAMGVGSGSWDVAMNVEGAVVERRLGRTVMPRFHAAFSIGTVAGAAAGAASAALGVPVAVHLILGAALAVVGPLVAVRAFLPAGTTHTDDNGDAATHAARPRRHPLRAWTEPRTLAIGLMVLAAALTEGTANDWLAVALVDGYDVHPAVGAAGFAAFVAAMTVGRVAGTGLLDRFGRVKVLWAGAALAAAGALVTVFGGVLALALVGVLLWGLGASLGFPVGMSAAADEPEFAAARVSVVSTVGYTAFLAGPPLLGYLGDHVGTLQALLVVAVLAGPSMLAIPAARPPATTNSLTPCRPRSAN